MKKVLAAMLLLCCLAVLVSELRKPRAGTASQESPSHPDLRPTTVAHEEARSPGRNFSFPRPIARPVIAPHVPVKATNGGRSGVLVEWNGHWYPAEIVQSVGDRHLIHYTGYGDEWNEWVGPDRLREGVEVVGPTPVAAAIPAESTKAPDGNASPKPSTPFEVEWNGSWWPADVLQENGGKYLIHYDGYGSNWDEWIPLERLRPSNAPKQ